jgi:glutamine amidotransferase
MQRLVIINYGSGNLHSAAKAFERAAAESGADALIEVTADPKAVAAADRIVLPGVGAFADCKAGLEAVAGMREALETAVRSQGRPFLGICVGAQLMAERGLEFGITPGFGWIKGDVQAIEPADPSLKIPHMGWNTLRVVNPHPLLEGIESLTVFADADAAGLRSAEACQDRWYLAGREVVIAAPGRLA